MFWIYVFIIVGISLAYVVYLQLSASKASAYRPVKSLFTPAERAFLGVLDSALGESYRVFGKVRTADVINPANHDNRSAWPRAQRRRNAEHFDFVVCHRHDLSVHCVIELDDCSLAPPRQRDQWIDSMCVAAQLKLIRVPVRTAYSIRDIRSLVIGDELDANEIADTRPEQDEKPKTKTDAMVSDEKYCPRCTSPMLKRLVQSGSHAGKYFWACSSYPHCRTVQAVEELATLNE